MCALWSFPVLVVVFVVALAEPASAHSPHDEVARIAADPRLPQHLFAVVRHMLLESFDLGVHWNRLSAGIWRHRLHDVCVIPPEDPLATTADVVVGAETGVLFRSSGHWQHSPIGHVRRLHTTRAGVFAVTADGRLLHSSNLSDWDVVDEGVCSVAGETDDVLVGTIDGVVRLGAEQLAFIGAPVTAILQLPSHMLIGSEDGLYLSAGNDLRRLDSRPITSLAAADGLVMASLRNEGTLSSFDDGLSFVESSAGLTTDEQAEDPAYRVPHFNQVAAVFDGESHRWFCAGFDGLFTTTDLKSWVELPDVLPRTLVAGLASVGDDLLYSTYGAGIVRRKFDGTEVQENRGLRAKRLFAATQVDSHTVFANHASGALRSEDGGESWSDVALARSNEMKARRIARVELLAKEAVYRAGGRLPPSALNHARSLYKRRAATRPSDYRLPAFGTQIVKIDESIYLASRTSGLYEFDESRGDFIRLREAPQGLLLGMVHLQGQLAILSSTGLEIRTAAGNWQHHDRPHTGTNDRLAADSHAFWVATGKGLYRSVDGITWDSHAVAQRDGDAVAVALVISGSGLVVQFDDGELWCHADKATPVMVGPKGTPIFRHAEAFPDLAPMITTSAEGLWASDQFGLFHLDYSDHTLASVARTMRFYADRPEIALSKGWRLAPSPSASGGVTAITSTGHLEFRFVGDGANVIGSGDCSVSVDGLLVDSIGDGDKLCEIGDLVDGMHLLRVEAVGDLMVEAIEVHR